MPTTTPTTSVMTSETTATPPRRAPVPPTNLRRRLSQAITRRAILAITGDDGMSTTEYAIGTLSAAAFAALLTAIGAVLSDVAIAALDPRVRVG